MGLDIMFRFRRIGSTPIRYEWDRPVYSNEDIECCGKIFNGRSEFECIKNWVGNERYGEYIPLDDKNFKELSKIIHTEIVSRNDGIDDISQCFDTDEYTWGLPALFAFILIAPAVIDFGWYLEIECGW